MVDTAVADEPAHLIFRIADTESLEGGLLTFGHCSLRKDCRADGARDIKMRRDYDPLS